MATPKPTRAPKAPQALVVRRARLDELVPDPLNARVHGERNLASIRASLEQFGQVEPLVVQKSSGRVIGGNGRREAMLALGMEEADVVDVDVDDATATRMAITLNRTAELAEWDYETFVDTIKEFNLLGEGELPGFELVELEQIVSNIDSAGVNSLSGEWVGMPEFDQRDKTAFRTLHVHFKDQGAVDEFAEKLGFKLTDKTKFAWYPSIEIELARDMVFVSDEP